MIRAILAWILKNASFSIYESPDPIGRRLGTHRLPYNYIIIHIEVSHKIVLLGYFTKT